MNKDILKPCEHCNGTGNQYSDEQGKQLRIERKAKGLTLEVVAKRIGVSTAYVSDLETGKRALNHGLVERFRDSLNDKCSHGVSPLADTTGSQISED